MHRTTEALWSSVFASLCLSCVVPPEVPNSCFCHVVLTSVWHITRNLRVFWQYMCAGLWILLNPWMILYVFGLPTNCKYKAATCSINTLTLCWTGIHTTWKFTSHSNWGLVMSGGSPFFKCAFCQNWTSMVAMRSLHKFCVRLGQSLATSGTRYYMIVLDIQLSSCFQLSFHLLSKLPGGCPVLCSLSHFVKLRLDGFLVPHDEEVRMVCLESVILGCVWHKRSWWEA